MGQTSVATLASVIGKISAQPQFFRAPQTAATALPPGPEQAPHLMERADWIGHVHETEGA
jgi:hypothetical protein